ncbi:MAG: hypothetical protein IJ496_04870 [Ruminococcus sp.]|nr:hypothetical protein [Ruminococcus sp.]
MQQENRRLRPILLMIFSSLFLHILHWIIYETIAFSWLMSLITPLVLCLCYHGFQTDCEKTFGLSRKRVFIYAVLVPLLIALGVSVLVFMNNPHLGLYSRGGQLTGGAVEQIGLYAGRTAMSGIYVLIFSAIDIPILQWQDHRRYEKESVRLTDADLAEKQVYQAPDTMQEHEEDLSV